MALNAHTLARLTNDELLRIAYIEIDPLASTTLEVELLQRLEDALRYPELPDGLKEPLDGYDLEKTRDLEFIRRALEFAEQNDVTEAADLLAACVAHDIYAPEDLRRHMARLDELERRLEDGELIENPETFDTFDTTTDTPTTA